MEEKQAMCDELSSHLQKLRKVTNMSQDELANFSGISRTRISQLETGAASMNWSQFMSLMMVFNANYDSKQYVFANRLFAPRFLQFLQRKEEYIPPDVSVDLRNELVMTYDEFQAFYKAFNSSNSN